MSRASSSLRISSLMGLSSIFLCQLPLRDEEKTSPASAGFFGSGRWASASFRAVIVSGHRFPARVQSLLLFQVFL
jgi:hypothetical protein